MLSSTLVAAAGLGATFPALQRWTTLRDVRGVPLLIGAALLAISLVGPLDAAGEQRSVAAHVVQHLLLISAVPAFLAAAFRDAVPAHVVSPRAAARLLAGALAVIFAVHVPVVMDATVRTPALNDVSHLAVLAAGLTLVWPLAAADPLRGWPALMYLGIAELLLGALGLLLAWYPEPLYTAYADLEPLFGLDRASDQALAGALLLVVEEPFLMIEVAILFFAILRDEGDDE